MKAHCLCVVSVLHQRGPWCGVSCLCLLQASEQSSGSGQKIEPNLHRTGLLNSLPKRHVNILKVETLGFHMEVKRDGLNDFGTGSLNFHRADQARVWDGQGVCVSLLKTVNWNEVHTQVS